MKRFAIPGLLVSCFLVSAPLLAQENSNIIRSAATIAVSPNDGRFWRPIDAFVSGWENDGAEYGCSAWAPLAATQPIGLRFVQTHACSLDQERTIQQREMNQQTQAVRNIGLPIKENRTVSPSHTREAVGTLESWVSIDPTYTAWANASPVTGCSNWAPAASTVAIGQVFVQTATDCSQNQNRLRQEREQEQTTGVVRNKGAEAIEVRTIAADAQRNATGTRPTKECRFTAYQNHWRVVIIQTQQPMPVGYEIYWDGARLHQGTPWSTESVRIGAYTYTKSTAVGGTDFYVCRE